MGRRGGYEGVTLATILHPGPFRRQRGHGGRGYTVARHLLRHRVGEQDGFVGGAIRHAVGDQLVSASRPQGSSRLPAASEMVYFSASGRTMFLMMVVMIVVQPPLATEPSFPGHYPGLRAARSSGARRQLLQRAAG